MNAEIAIRESDLVPQGGNTYTVTASPNIPGKGQWLSIQADGTLGRSDNIGPWELGTRDGGKIGWSSPTAYLTGCYALPVVSGL